MVADQFHQSFVEKKSLILSKDHKKEKKCEFRQTIAEKVQIISANDLEKT